QFRQGQPGQPFPGQTQTPPPIPPQSFPPEENSFLYGTGYMPAAPSPERFEQKAIRRDMTIVGLIGLLWLGISLFFPVILQTVLFLLFPGKLYYEGTTLTGLPGIAQIFDILCYIPMMLLPFVFYGLVVRIPFSVAIPLKRPRMLITFAGFLMGMGVAMFANFCANGAISFFGIFGLVPNLPEPAVPTDLLGQILYLVSIAVFPAILEEVAFRGILMQSLRRHGDIFALIFSSVVFGFFHLNFAQAPFAMVVGAIMGYITLKAGSLIPAILIHFCNNLLSGLLSIAELYLTESGYLLLNNLYLTVALGLGIIGFFLFLSKDESAFFVRSKEDTVLTTRQRVKAGFSAPGLIVVMIIFGIFMLFSLSPIATPLI
ncbi:MAG: CPBP family intramembrane metalloprotease, partial [Ruminococcaceae bacterium]|nr:CPBP family intramembrane metalloprotease [Oscillospiraceae bacterium]